ncbi:MAG: Fic family protein [Desulfobulbia bacterium]
MTDHLQQLDALSRDPRLQVRPEQRAALVGNIVHTVMHPYFLKRTPEEQEHCRSQYLEHLRLITDYCLREYVESPEPRLTIEVIKGLHRVLYYNNQTVQTMTTDGAITTMKPGEFKTMPVFIRSRIVPGRLFSFTAPECVAQEMDVLLAMVHDGQAALFQRYLHLILDLFRIHPFQDGNGRVAMLLGDLFLLKYGVQPPYFARYIRENKQECYQLLERYRLDPQQDISVFYPPLLRLYEGCGFVPHFQSTNN